MFILFAGRAIRHRACALKDMAHALIDAELDESFEKQCREILESRRNRGKQSYFFDTRLNNEDVILLVKGACQARPP